MASTYPLDNITLTFQNLEDPRTKNWPLISNPLAPLTLCVAYLFCVKVLGPKLMENRKPYELKSVIFVYNLFQVVLSSWLFYGFAINGWLTGDYNLVCAPMDISVNPKNMGMVHVTWWYFFAKLTELFETIFFVMRKKFSQVNFLHVYHHGIMVFSGWLATKYYPVGHGTFAGMVNSFVHILMYTYYLLSGFGPNVQKYLWWKKYLTTLQMVQFVIILMHDIILLFTDCQFPRIFNWYMICLSISFFFLFKQFYSKTYKVKKDARLKN